MADDGRQLNSAVFPASGLVRNHEFANTDTAKSTVVAGYSLDAIAASDFTATVSGGIVLAGDASGTVGFVGPVSGGLVLAGSGAGTYGLIGPVSGGVTLAGGSAGTVGLIGPASGGITLSGTGGEVIGINAGVSGGITFAGSSGGTVGLVGPVAGGLTLASGNSGSVGFSVSASGGLSFTGSAVEVVDLIATISGGIAFSGAAHVESSSEPVAPPVAPPVATGGGGGWGRSPAYRPLRPVVPREEPRPVPPTAHYSATGRVQVGFRASATTEFQRSVTAQAKAQYRRPHGMAVTHQAVSVVAAAAGSISLSGLTLIEFVPSRRHIEEEEFLALVA